MAPSHVDQPSESARVNTQEFPARNAPVILRTDEFAGGGRELPAQVRRRIQMSQALGDRVGSVGEKDILAVSDIEPLGAHGSRDHGSAGRHGLENFKPGAASDPQWRDHGARGRVKWPHIVDCAGNPDVGGGECEYLRSGIPADDRERWCGGKVRCGFFVPYQGPYFVDEPLNGVNVRMIVHGPHKENVAPRIRIRRLFSRSEVRDVDPVRYRLQTGPRHSGEQFFAFAIAGQRMDVAAFNQSAFGSFEERGRAMGEDSPRQRACGLSVPAHNFRFDIVPVGNNQASARGRPNERDIGKEVDALDLNRVIGGVAQEPCQFGRNARGGVIQNGHRVRTDESAEQFRKGVTSVFRYRNQTFKRIAFGRQEDRLVSDAEIRYGGSPGELAGEVIIAEARSGSQGPAGTRAEIEDAQLFGSIAPRPPAADPSDNDFHFFWFCQAFRYQCLTRNEVCSRATAAAFVMITVLPRGKTLCINFSLFSLA